MKHIKAQKTEAFRNGMGGAGPLYIFNDPTTQFALFRVDGKMPINGIKMPLSSAKELYYVISGEIFFITQGEKIALKEGDLLLKEPFEEYYWEGKGMMYNIQLLDAES